MTRRSSTRFEVRTVIKHVKKRLRRHWPKTRIGRRGDSPYGCVEAMHCLRPRRQWRARRPSGGGRPQSALPSCDEQRGAPHLCELRLQGQQLETAAQSGGSARVLAATGRGSDRHAPGGRYPLRRHLARRLGAAPYENVYCQRGQTENLIKMHKAQLASDRMSCHSATANQVRLVLHTRRERAAP
jgi:Transposase DDE domain group 1